MTRKTSRLRYGSFETFSSSLLEADGVAPPPTVPHVRPDAARRARDAEAFAQRRRARDHDFRALVGVHGARTRWAGSPEDRVSLSHFDARRARPNCLPARQHRHKQNGRRHITPTK